MKAFFTTILDYAPFLNVTASIHSPKTLTYTYVFIGIISCFICSVLTPPKFYPDENHHYFRVVSLAEGKLFPLESQTQTKDLFWYSGFVLYSINDSDAGYKVVTLDESHVNFIEGGLQLKDLWSNKNTLLNSPRVSLYLENTKHYLFTGYAIPAFVYRMVSLCTRNLYFRLISTRFLTGLFFMTVIAFTIYKAKRYQMVVFAVATLPITSYLISSLAPDGILITTSLLLFVLVINILEDKDTNTLTNKIFLILYSLVLSITKPGYFIWSFALWILAFKDKKWVSTVTVISIFSILGCVVPYLFLSKLYPSPTPVEILKLSQYSILDLLNHPNEVLRRVGIFLLQDSFLIGKQMICTYAWTRFYLPEKMYIVYVVVLLIGLTYKEEKPTWDLMPIQKIILTLVVFLGAGFILFVFLMIKDCSGICGVQGRYFLPYMPLAFVLIQTFIRVKIMSQKLIYNMSVSGIILLNLFANAYLWYIFYYYWN